MYGTDKYFFFRHIFVLYLCCSFSEYVMELQNIWFLDIAVVY